MRVLINRLTALRQRTGIGHYIAELMRSLAEQGHGQEMLGFPGPVTASGIGAWKTVMKALRGLRGHAAATTGLSKPSTTASGFNFWHTVARDWARWQFRAFWSWRAFDLYHEPNTIPFPCDRPTVATIHDLSVALHPEWHPYDRVRHFEKNFEPGLRRCVHFLTNSEFTRQELMRHYHIPAERITRTYLGIRANFRPLRADVLASLRRRLDLPERYFLYVGTLEPRKNLLRLLEAYTDLPAGLRERCPLVLAGGWGWKTEALREYYEQHARHRHVRHLGYVADPDLPGLYSAARALVFPSLHEGFGLPTVEMLACGGAVFASNIPPHAEVLGSTGLLLDPLDVAAWRAALRRAIHDDDWLAVLRQGGRDRAAQFTWDSCARETWNVYRQVLGQARGARRAA